MHDNQIIICTFHLPWTKYRVATLWHVDPEIGGDEDSCDFTGYRKSQENGWWDVVKDSYESLSPSGKEAVNFMWWAFKDKLTARPWWKSPKLHIGHWRLQVHVMNTLKRWLFSRCTICGKRFTWRESLGHVIGTWDSTGPSWFKQSESIVHISCYRERAAARAWTKGG